ncbi:hypothetical protein DFJ63DRAFT_336023 [Scheffersomyces coipomensis]|uniref:uncharacterized protein n=1 Tax=Scheffersomyces coipomensis TaxID=1788519 RepID=UPI00315C8752
MAKEEEDPLSKCPHCSDTVPPETTTTTVTPTSCKCRSSSSSSLYHKKLHKLLRKIKSNDQSTKDNLNNYSLNSSSINIFERSLENNNPLLFNNGTNNNTNNINNNGTNNSNDNGIPLHYKLENFTNPILDITTDYLSDPNVDFNDVKLNYYDDDQPQDGTNNNDFPSPHNTMSTNMAEYPFRARSRSRSIISNNLLNTLSQSSQNSNSSSNTTNNTGSTNASSQKLYRRNSSFSTMSNSSMLSSKRPSFINSYRSRQQSLATSTTPSQGKVTNRSKDSVDPSIDFYSFADMLSHEDEEEEAILESILNHHINDVMIDDDDDDDDDDYEGDEEEFINQLEEIPSQELPDDEEENDVAVAQDDDDEDEDEVDSKSHQMPRPTRTHSLTLEDKIALTNALPLSPSLRRSSYTTISVKDYIGVL